MMPSPLGRYEEILSGSLPARYLLARSVKVELQESLPLPERWALHDRMMQDLREAIGRSDAPRIVSPNLMDLKVSIARDLVRECSLCEHRCGTDRYLSRGRCGVTDSRISSQFVHMGEEEPLVPSYTVFFSGCNLKCVFCQNYDISTCPEAGLIIPSREMALQMGRLARPFGAEPRSRSPGDIRNVNWVGGDPTPNLPYVMEVLSRSDANIAQVWNSNMYLTEHAMSLLEGCIDIYLTDLKFGNDACAMRLSGAPCYMRTATRNHLMAAAQGEVIVRHLMLPGHLHCCTLPVVEWLAENMPGAAVNIMAQYRPAHQAWRYQELRDAVPRGDHRKVLEIARTKGLALI